MIKIMDYIWKNILTIDQISMSKTQREGTLYLYFIIVGSDSVNHQQNTNIIFNLRYKSLQSKNKFFARWDIKLKQNKKKNYLICLILLLCDIKWVLQEEGKPKSRIDLLSPRTPTNALNQLFILCNISLFNINFLSCFFFSDHVWVVEPCIVADEATSALTEPLVFPPGGLYFNNSSIFNIVSIFLQCLP